MNPGAGWQSAKDLFAACLDKTSEERAALLGACDPATRTEVESLLRFHQRAGDFLDQPALDVIPPPGQKRFGPYVVVRKIGDGGMGVVYEAARADGQFEQRVAVKVLRQTLADPLLLSRFRAERQILAQLAHPNICRLLDGGATPDGLPYLVMERIEGDRLDVYARQLPLEQRLKLFLPVCGAVQYAHEQHVLHRDLKPANILVTPEGVPKLLDFGIVRTVAGNPDEAVATATVHRVATPGYASPEQLSGRPLGPASDVYSLGVILYELLTGRRPSDVVPTGAPDVPRPSAITRADRQTSRRLAGDLDNVVMKAMRTEPEYRYPSARELAADIERYLKGQPVLARKGGFWYRTGKTLSRRRTAIAAAAAFVAGLTSWQLLSRVTPQAHRSLAVVAFQNLANDPALDWLDRGISELLTTSLAQTGAFEVVSTERIRGIMQRLEPNGPLPAARMADAARASGADLFVSGAVLGTGGKMTVELRVQETSSGKVLLAERFEGDGPQAIFAVSDNAAGHILRRLEPRFSAATPKVSLVTTSSVEALRAYETARALLDRSQVEPSVKLLQRAIEDDPDFAMAYVVLAGCTGAWDLPYARRIMARAVDIAARKPLPKLQRVIIESSKLYYDGRYDEAAVVLEQAKREFPREPELLHTLASCRPLTNAAAAVADAQEILRIDDRYAYAYLDLLTFAPLAGQFRQADDALERYCSLVGPGDECVESRAENFLVQGRFDEALKAFAAMGSGQNNYTPAVLMLKGDYPAADEKLRGSQLAPAVREFLRGNIEVARGNLESGARHFEASAKEYKESWFRYDQLYKAAEIYFEQGQPARALELAARHNSPWLPGIRAIAYSMLGNPVAAETELTALRAGVAPLWGDFRADHVVRLHRLLAAGYSGHHQQVVDLGPEIKLQYTSMAELPMGRAYLALGNLPLAEKHLRNAYASRLLYAIPGILEQQSALRYMLAEFYLSQTLEKAGRLDETKRFYLAFLAHFPNLPSSLPQVSRARSAIARFR